MHSFLYKTVLLTGKLRHKSHFCVKLSNNGKTSYFHLLELKIFLNIIWHNFQWNMKFHFVYLTNIDLFDIILVSVKWTNKTDHESRKKGVS